MAKLLSSLVIAILCLGIVVAAKKDKFKLKAKGYGLSHLQQAMNPQAPLEEGEEAAPAPTPAPYYYYPPPAAPAVAPPVAPAPAPAPAQYYYGNGNGAATAEASAATSAALMAGAASQHVMPVIVPFAVVAHSPASLPLSQPPMSAGLSASAASFSHNGGYSYNGMPKIDLDYMSYPYYGMSAKRSYAPYAEDEYEMYADNPSRTRWGYSSDYGRETSYRG